MFLTDLFAALATVGSDPGEDGFVMGGKWTFCKRGQNYGVKLIGELPQFAFRFDEAQNGLLVSNMYPK